MYAILLRELIHLLKTQWMRDLWGFGAYGSERHAVCIETYLSEFISKRHKNVFEDMQRAWYIFW
jgi:hypothetical protein